MRHRSTVVFTTVLCSGLCLLTGCHQAERRPGPQPAAAHMFDPEPAPHLQDTQVADVQVSIAASWEQQGKTKEAMAAYRRALENDAGRMDAAARLAILHDRRAEFEESEKLHRQALNAQPRRADYLCNYGYSLHLQERWDEAEAVLRKALDSDPRHQRAHNNLGLVLAHMGRHQEALDEFRRGGASKADAHTNLAFILALQKNLGEAKVHYQQALQASPSSGVAKKGLAKVNQLIAREGNTVRRVASANLEGPIQPATWESAAPPTEGP